MAEDSVNSIYKKAIKVRANLLLYTEKCIKQSQKRKNSYNINYLQTQNLFQEGSMIICFEEFYDEKNLEIYTQELENKEKKIIPHLSSISFFHSSEKVLCKYNNLSDLSTVESTTQKAVENIENNNNEKYFLNKKSKTKTENKEKMFFFEKYDNKFIFNNENVNENKNENNKTVNGNLTYDNKKHNAVGKKYLHNLSKYLGVIHKKKKMGKKSLIKKQIKNNKS